jgi:hypothetical protein
MCWSVGPLVCWSVGLLVCWSVGPLVCWSVGPLVCWSVGPLFCRSIGLLVHWFVGPLVGGVIIKKTTNKIRLTLSFSQNQIRGLAVCLLFFFFEGASGAFKNEAPKRESSFGKGRLLTCAHLPILSINLEEPGQGGQPT